MRDKQLSRRLQAAAGYIRKGDRLADIGSDHAYLPCVLVEEGTIDFSIAGEVAQGPYERSFKEVRARNLEKKIEVRKGNGLAILQPKDNITTVSICGMGGVLITSILQEGKQTGKLDSVERLVLQPNVSEETVRKWLDQNLYQILDETVVFENRKYYEVIFAQKDEKKQVPSYTEAEYRYGVTLPVNCPPFYIAKWKAEIHKKELIVQQLQQAGEAGLQKETKIKAEIEETKEMLNKCRESKGKH